MQAGATHDADEIGVRRPVPTPVAELGPGEVGYLIAGIKDVGEARSRRDRHRRPTHRRTEALEGYRDPKPMVFCGLYPDRRRRLREPPREPRAAEAQRRRRSPTRPRRPARSASASAAASSACCTWRSSSERLEREFDLALIATAPSRGVPGAHAPTASVEVVDNPADLPDAAEASTASRSRTSGSRSSRRRTTRAR